MAKLEMIGIDGSNDRGISQFFQALISFLKKCTTRNPVQLARVNGVAFHPLPASLSTADHYAND